MSEQPKKRIRAEQLLIPEPGMSRRKLKKLRPPICIDGEFVHPDTHLYVTNEWLSFTVADEPFRARITLPPFVVMNKELGTVCTREPDRDGPSVFNAFVLEPWFESIQSIGRLDKDTAGLLLFTGDGPVTPSTVASQACDRA